MSNEMPPTWAQALVRRGFVDSRRKRNDVPSMSRLAEAAGVSVETVRRMVNRMGTPDQDTVKRIAKALELPTTLIASWAEQLRDEESEWSPPSESALLTTEERKALDRLIRLMVADRLRRKQADEYRRSPEGIAERAASPDPDLVEDVRRMLGRRLSQDRVAADERPQPPPERQTDPGGSQ